MISYTSGQPNCRRRGRTVAHCRQVAAIVVGAAVAVAVALVAPAAAATTSASPHGRTLSAATRPATAPGSSRLLLLPGLHAKSYTVTLITGDQVTLTAAGTGRYSITATMAPRLGGIPASLHVTAETGVKSGDSVYAVPSDAAPLIAAGLVDKQLFNVGYLAEHHDTLGATLPVLIHYATARSATTQTAQADALPGVSRAARPGTGDIVTADVSLRKAAAFWAVLSGAAHGGQPAAASHVHLADDVGSISLEGTGRPGSGHPRAAGASRMASTPLYTVTANLIGRQGVQPCAQSDPLCYNTATLLGITGAGAGVSYTTTTWSCNTSGCELQFSVPAGTYMMDGQAFFRLGSREEYLQLTNPQFTVAGSTQIQFNANAARQATVVTPQPTQTVDLGFSDFRTLPDGTTFYNLYFWAFGYQNLWFMPPGHPVTEGSVTYASQWMLAKPPVTMTVNSPEALQLNPIYYSTCGAGPVCFTGRRTLPLIYANLGRKQDFSGINAHGKLVMIRTCDVLKSQLTNAMQAGAAGVLVDPVIADYSEGSCLIPVLPSWVFTGGKAANIPYASIPAEQASALLTLLSQGTVRVTVAGSETTPYMYNLKFYQQGQVPKSPVITVTRQQLAELHVKYHASNPVSMQEENSAFASNEHLALGSDYAFSGPAYRDEYFGPVSPGVVNEQTVISGSQSQATLAVFDNRGSNATEDWNDLPNVPGAPEAPTDVLRAQPGTWANSYLCSGCRQGNTFFPETSLIASDPRLEGDEAGEDPSTVQLYQDGQEIQPTPVDGLAAYTLPAKQARYQLTVNNADTDTSWDFTSAGSSTDRTPPGYGCLGTVLGLTGPCQAAPLVFLRYDAGLSLHNTWAAPGTHQLQVTAYHQATHAAAITSLKLWTSVNGGATWKKAALTSNGDGAYTTTITMPRLGSTNGMISIKTQASDADGNDVTQILYNAWGLSAAR